MAITYDTYVNQISNLVVIGSTTPEFQTMLPGMIDYAEQRVYRELNLLGTQVRDVTNLSTTSRNLTLPSAFGEFVVVSDINVITPSGTTISCGTRNQLNPAAIAIVDFLYPQEVASTTPSVPTLFAMVNQNIAVVGPPPDSPYQVEVIGTIRPTALSSANSSTFLTQHLPDLFIAASMVFGSGYMRDFGQQADNPQMGAAWEAQYNLLLKSATTEEVRKKYNSAYPGSYQPTPTSGGAE